MAMLISRRESKYFINKVTLIFCVFDVANINHVTIFLELVGFTALDQCIMWHTSTCRLRQIASGSLHWPASDKMKMIQSRHNPLASVMVREFTSPQLGLSASCPVTELIWLCGAAQPNCTASVDPQRSTTTCDGLQQEIRRFLHFVAGFEQRSRPSSCFSQSLQCGLRHT